MLPGAGQHLLPELPALLSPRGSGWRAGRGDGEEQQRAGASALAHLFDLHCPQTRGHLQPAGAARAGSHLVKEGTSPCCLNIVNCVLNGGHSLRNLNSSSLCPRLPPAKVLSIIRSKTYLHSCRPRGRHTPVRVWVFMDGLQAFLLLCFQRECSCLQQWECCSKQWRWPGCVGQSGVVVVRGEEFQGIPPVPSRRIILI